MKNSLIYLILLSTLFFFEAKPYLIYAGLVSESKEAKQSKNKEEELQKIQAELEKEAEEKEEEAFENFKATRKLLYEKLARRTKGCRDELDGLFFTVNTHARKSIEAKNFKAEKELIVVLSDYNSVLGDLGLMQVILDLGKFAEDEKFLDYYDLMESGYERLKDSFSLKNEIFLDRIDKLKNQDALRYEKKLLRCYKDYFEYDLRMDKIGKENVQDEVKQQQNRGQ